MSVRRHDDRRARAAQLLVQLAARGLPDVHRARRATRDRPGPRHPGSRQECRAGSGRAVGAADHGRQLAPQDHRGGLPQPWLGPEEAPSRPACRGDPAPPVRPEGRAGRHPLQARARRELVQGDVRGRGHEPRAAVQGNRIRVHQGRAGEVHGRAAVSHLQGQAAPPGGPRRHDRRPRHLRGRRPCDHRHAGVGTRASEPHLRARANDRPPGAQGDPGAARVPRRRRAGLPHREPHEPDPVGRRGTANSPRDPDRHDADGRAVHPGRAVDRAAPARQREAHRDAHAPARPRQHRARRRARRGDDPHRRLGHRHRARRGGARRRDHRQRPAGRGPRRAAFHHGCVPPRRAQGPGSEAAPEGQRQAAPGEGRAPAQPQGPRRGLPARDVHRRDRRVRERQEHARDRGAVPSPRTRAVRVA